MIRPEPTTSAPLLAARKTIEAEIERLIALLDAMDGDPDLEPNLATTAGEDLTGAYHLTIDEDGDVLDRGEENHRDYPRTAEEAWYRPTAQAGL